MPIKVIYSPETEADLYDGYDWYESRRIGLGEDFLSRVEACIAGIQRMPEKYVRVYGTFRRGLVRRFPYAIFYEYAEGEITIYGILPTASKPGKWTKRIPQ